MQVGEFNRISKFMSEAHDQLEDEEMAFGAKSKGSTFERDLAKWLTENGYPSKRVPLSGAVKEYPGDVSMDFHGTELLIEAKAVEGSYKTPHALLETVSFCLMLGLNGKETYLALRPDMFLALLEGKLPEPVNMPAIRTKTKTIEDAMRGAHIFVTKLNRKPWAFLVPMETLERLKSIAS